MTNKRKILVADASKVVRASLAKQLADEFEVREESNGESAWQTLVLDGTIVGVVSGLGLNKLDGFGLLERVRVSKVSRLNRLPFFLLVSSSFPDDDRQKALALGVTNFVVKGSNASVDAVFSALRDDCVAGSVGDADGAGSKGDSAALALSAAGQPEALGPEADVGDVLGCVGDLAGPDFTERHDMADAGNPLPSQEPIEAYLTRCMPRASVDNGVGVIAFALDGYDDLIARHGRDRAIRTTEKFLSMLAKKIRPENWIGQLPDGRVMIAAEATSLDLCTRFATRICKAMATAQISVRGQRLDLTVSAGIASMPDDGVDLTAPALLHLVHDRLAAARKGGGNRIVARPDHPGSGLGNRETFVPQLKDLLATTDPAVLRPCLGTVGMELMPLLRELERTFRFGLPIDEMTKRLWDRARAERMAT